MPDFSAPRKAVKNQNLLWLFDLDNTLHDAGRHIFPAIEQNMNAFIGERLGQDAASVSRLAPTVLATLWCNGTRVNQTPCDYCAGFSAKRACLTRFTGADAV